MRERPSDQLARAFMGRWRQKVNRPRQFAAFAVAAPPSAGAAIAAFS